MKFYRIPLVLFFLVAGYPSAAGQKFPNEISGECASVFKQATLKYNHIAELLSSDDVFESNNIDLAESIVEDYIEAIGKCDQAIPSILMVGGTHVFPGFAVDSIISQYEMAGIYIDAFREASNNHDKRLKQHMIAKFMVFYKEVAIPSLEKEVASLPLSENAK